jgi:hypothetical protein
MTKSKDLFLMMREQEIQTNNFLPTKKEIIKNTEIFIDAILDAGEIDKYELLSQAKRLYEALDVINAKIIKSLPNENFEAFGLIGTFRNGGETLNLKEDYLYNDLERKLKERAELIKTACNSTELIYGSDGVQVTKVSTTPRKSSLTIIF